MLNKERSLLTTAGLDLWLLTASATAPIRISLSWTVACSLSLVNKHSRCRTSLLICGVPSCKLNSTNACISPCRKKKIPYHTEPPLRETVKGCGGYQKGGSHHTQQYTRVGETREFSNSPLRTLLTCPHESWIFETVLHRICFIRRAVSKRCGFSERIQRFREKGLHHDYSNSLTLLNTGRIPLDLNYFNHIQV